MSYSFIIHNRIIWHTCCYLAITKLNTKSNPTKCIRFNVIVKWHLNTEINLNNTYSLCKIKRPLHSCMIKWMVASFFLLLLSTISSAIHVLVVNLRSLHELINTVSNNSRNPCSDGRQQETREEVRGRENQANRLSEHGAFTAEEVVAWCALCNRFIRLWYSSVIARFAHCARSHSFCFLFDNHNPVHMDAYAYSQWYC